MEGCVAVTAQLPHTHPHKAGVKDITLMQKHIKLCSEYISCVYNYVHLKAESFEYSPPDANDLKDTGCLKTCGPFRLHTWEVTPENEPPKMPQNSHSNSF